MGERRVREYRDQAERYRQTAAGCVAAVADRYAGWADDLDRRADEMELAALTPTEGSGS